MLFLICYSINSLQTLVQYYKYAYIFPQCLYFSAFKHYSFVFLIEIIFLKHKCFFFLQNHGWRTLHQPYKDSLTFIQSNILHRDPIKTFLCGRTVHKFLSIVPYLPRRDLNHRLYLLMCYSCDRFAADKCLTLVENTMNK